MIRKSVTICLIVLACGMLAGCKKGGEAGGSIRFMPRSGFLPTRTAYSGEGYDASNNEVTESSNVLAKERIDWVQGDEFTVWSDEARHITDASRHWSNYIVQSLETEDVLYSRATVDPSDHNGLQWGDAAGPFHFYARYPADGTKINGTAMTGTIPAQWNGSGTPQMTWTTKTEGGATRTIGTPDMSYAYMFASATAARNADAVRLEFDPKFTAFQFSIGSGDNDEVNLTSFTLETLSSGSYIAGDFTFTYAGSSVSVGSGASQSITVNLTGKRVTPTTPLTFTVLALPVDMTSMKISFTGPEIGTQTLKLNHSADSSSGDTPITFAACKKHRIYGLRFPEPMSAHGEYIEWDHNAYGESIAWDDL